MNINTASQEYNSISENVPLTSELERYYNTALTKPDIDILKELYHSPQIQHKVLATNLNTSTNSLSNRFNRLAYIQPPLIITERIGRTKYYSLTETARAFVEHQFPPKNNLVHKFVTTTQDNALLNDTLNILNRFQQVIGTEWDVYMDDILSGNVLLDKKDDESDEIRMLYEDFIINLKKLYAFGKNSCIQDVYNTLNQNVLIHRLKEFLDKELTHYRSLESLFELERQDFEKAFLLIDYVFTQINPIIFRPYDSMQPIQSLMLSTEQINSVTCAILSMVNEFRDYNGNTALAINHWKETYLTTSAALYHIADKCYTIYYSDSKKM